MISAVKMIPFRARATKNDLVELEANDPASGTGPLADLGRRMSGCIIKARKKRYIGILS